jgi:hypothetical protein
MTMGRRVVAAVLAFVAGGAVAAGAPAASPHPDYLKPQVRVGEQITDVYAKSVSWSGPGLKGHVARYSGTSTYTVTSVEAGAIAFDELDRADGRPPSPAVGAKVLADGNTWCFNGECRINDQTSGVFFIPLLWGTAPEEVHAGSAWRVEIDKPWEIGPKGEEQVRVVDTDPVNGAITLMRHGTGEGWSSDELRWVRGKTPFQITTADGEQVVARPHPGTATWSGYTTIRRGVIVSDEIMLTQQMEFVARDGRSWHAELRVYTLLDLASDTGAIPR